MGAERRVCDHTGCKSLKLDVLTLLTVSAGNYNRRLFHPKQLVQYKYMYIHLWVPLDWRNESDEIKQTPGTDHKQLDSSLADPSQSAMRGGFYLHVISTGLLLPQRVSTWTERTAEQSWPVHSFSHCAEMSTFQPVTTVDP